MEDSDGNVESRCEGDNAKVEMQLGWQLSKWEMMKHLCYAVEARMGGKKVFKR